MKKLIRSKDSILCMANVRGKYVVNPGKLKFSFYFSSDDGITHGIRVEPVFNPEKMLKSMTGTLKLCDDWNYIPGPNDNAVSSKDVNDMKRFFRKYLVLFCMVWDEQLQDGVLEDYFKGTASFREMLEDISFYNEYSEYLDKIDNVDQLESFCRMNKLVNMQGN